MPQVASPGAKTSPPASLPSPRRVPAAYVKAGGIAGAAAGGTATRDHCRRSGGSRPGPAAATLVPGPGTPAGRSSTHDVAGATNRARITASTGSCPPGLRTRPCRSIAIPACPCAGRGPCTGRSMIKHGDAIRSDARHREAEWRSLRLAAQSRARARRASRTMLPRCRKSTSHYAAGQHAEPRHEHSCHRRAPMTVGSASASDSGRPPPPEGEMARRLAE